MLDRLPRSVRWRIQLGLLDDVDSTTLSPQDIGSRSGVRHEFNGCDTGTLNRNNQMSVELDGGYHNQHHEVQSIKVDPLLEHTISNPHNSQASALTSPSYSDNNVTLTTPQQHHSHQHTSDVSSVPYDQYYQSLETQNFETLAKHRLRYDTLVTKHYWNGSPLAIIQQTEKGDGTPIKHHDHVNTNDSSVTVANNRTETKTPFNSINDKSVDKPTPLTTNTSHTSKNIIRKSIHSQETESTTQKPATSSSMADPLSVMAMLQEQETQIEREKEIQERRERALAARSRTSKNNSMLPSSPQKESGTTSGETMNTPAGQHPRQNQYQPAENDGDVNAQWMDFYTSRKIIDVIDKDLPRLPSDHHVWFSSWKTMCKEQSQRCGATEGVRTSGAGCDLMPTVADPSPLFDTDVSGNDIDLDGNNEGEVEDTDDEVKAHKLERANKISQVLFVYAKENPVMGYRQGMHEIASLILLSLEMDLCMEMGKKDEDHNREESDGEDCAFDGCPVISDENEGNEGKQTNKWKLLDLNHIMNDTYIIFEAVMSHLSPAYEVKQSRNTTYVSHGSEDVDGVTSYASDSTYSPMELMGLSILNKIRYVAGDEELYQFIVGMQIPVELYSTRWIRLMFSREVTGWSNVMALWDVFFRQLYSLPVAVQTTSIQQRRSIPSTSTTALMNILESTATVMILTIRNKLIPLPSPLSLGINKINERDPNECIDLLMNYSQIEDLSKVIGGLMNLINRQHELNRLAGGGGSKIGVRSWFKLAEEDHMKSSMKHHQQQNQNQGHQYQHHQRQNQYQQHENSNKYIKGGHDKANSYKMGSTRNGMQHPLQQNHYKQNSPPPISLSHIAKSSITALKGAWDKTSLPNLSEAIEKKNLLPNLSEFSEVFDKTMSNFGGGTFSAQDDSTVVTASNKSMSNEYNLSYRPPISDHDEASENKAPFSSMVETKEPTEVINFKSEHNQPNESDEGVQLAARLESSLADLVSYFKTEVLMGNNNNMQNGCEKAHSYTKSIESLSRSNINRIPESVWNALADIDSVRNDLCSKSIIIKRVSKE